MNGEAAQVVVNEAWEAVKNAQRRLDTWLDNHPDDIGEEYSILNDALKEAREFYLKVSQQNALNVSEPTAMPKGPVIDMTSTGILEFLETQMEDTKKFHRFRRLLSPANLAFKFAHQSDNKIPVCAGLSGLGKSRMLEEWENMFDLADIHEPRLGALVLYYNGHKPHVIEGSMTMEASFSWRILHRLFIEENGVEFSKWFNECLPKNGAELQLRIALEVIRE
ncbi:hypothetical protein AC1031_004351 [Aphanomyces cochlioides]|nr:hypothetical protein AC1031_004351 [Aphanomyces cochlioides]